MSQEKAKILRLGRGTVWDEKKRAVEAALILGFKSEAAEFPAVSFEEGIPVPGTQQELLELLKQEKEPIKEPKDYVSATKRAKPAPEFDWRKKKGLESVFVKGEFLKDTDHDMLPDKLNFHMVISEDASDSVLAAACNFAYRFGMETTAFEGSFVKKEDTGGNALIFEEREDTGMSICEAEDGYKVVISGSGKSLEEFSARICEGFPWTDGFDSWVRILQDMTDSMAMKNEDGFQIYREAYKADPVKDYKRPVKVYEETYDIPWEVDCFREILEKEVYSSVHEGSRAVIRAALSEDRKVREELEEEIRQRLADLGVIAENISVLCAYKQGYSWLEEVIVPQLKGTKPDKITIAFKPFLKEGVTEWNDENGATPSYNNTSQDREGQWYDLPIRYLQELYPAEDMLVRELGLDREQIQFEIYEGAEDITYQVTVWEDGQEALREEYLARQSERPYLDAYPGMGIVHPSTGYVQVCIDGKEILNERIQTDVEAVWDIYQKDVLVKLCSFIEEKTGGSISAAGQPFFSQLKLEAVLSEPDEKLPSREDMISTLDALHEDLYFAGADYFKNYGMEKAGAMLEEPGLILPVIKKGYGKPYFKVTLYEQAGNAPELIRNGERIDTIPSREEIKVWIDEILYRDGEPEAVIRIDGITENVAEACAELLSRGSLEFGRRITSGNTKAGIRKVTLKTDKTAESAVLPVSKSEEKDLDIRDIDILPDTLIGYDQYLEIIEKLKRVPGLLVYRTAVSYQGREIYAIEILPKRRGYVSRTKRITYYPSEIINCRHHANEVSSTNAAFMLIKTLLTDTQYKDVADKLNLVIVPMENVDGAAIHYELQKENPYWKLHVARFNSIGKEFYYEHFKPDTKHTEAMGLTRLFETFLPDVIVDNHGVPSHEWEQQFAGYTSPSYKGFWLPRSLLYGYFWYVTDEEYRGNYAVNKKMEDVIADAIAANDDMRSLNREWAAQFEEYAHKWMPKLFPADYYKEMINYWIPFAADPLHRYPSIRFPWITTVAYTSEVADETAQGDYLNLCARAHLTHDLATIKMLLDSKSVYENIAESSDGSIRAAYIRQRPMLV